MSDLSLRVVGHEDLRGRIKTVIIGCRECREEPIRAAWDCYHTGGVDVQAAQRALRNLHEELGVGHECGDSEVYMDLDEFSGLLNWLWVACREDRGA